MVIIGRYHVTFDHKETTVKRARFVVRIWSVERPDFMAGSYYDSTFLDIKYGTSLQMMGGVLTAAEVAGIQNAIRDHVMEVYGYSS